MPTPVLFIQGAGDMHLPEGSGKLVAWLEDELGAGFELAAPEMPDADEPDPKSWIPAIQANLEGLGSDGLVVAHSFGASLLLKHLAESDSDRPLRALFLIATPYWERSGWQAAYALPEDFAAELPPVGKMVLYHSRGDPECPFAHLARYREALPTSEVRELEGTEHSFTEGLPELVNDIRSLAR
jgi:predicted alpha/beta hydrolase family esterase